MSAKSTVSDFFNKNKALVVFLILTLIVSAVLIVLCVTTCSTINSTIKDIEDKGKQVETINRKGKAKDRTNPKIVEGNATGIEEDAKNLFNKTLELQRVCGQGYDSCFINAFCAEDMPEFSVYLDAFTAVSKKSDMNIVKYLQAPSYSTLKKFFEAVRNEVAEDDQAKAKFDAAFEVFKKDLAKYTVEDMKQFESSPESAGDLPAKAIFLQVLGLPRTINDDNFLAYRSRLEKAFTEAYADEKSKVVSVTELERMLKNKREDDGREDRGVMGQQSESKPVQQSVVHLCKLFQIYEQVFQRVKEVRDGSKEHDFMLIRCMPAKDIEFGYKDLGKGYLSYQFELTVRGNLSDVRSFVNKLHSAYEQNHVFVMYDFSMKSYVPERTGKKDFEIDLNSEIFRHVFAYGSHLNNLLVSEIAAEADNAAADNGTADRQEGIVQDEKASKKILKDYEMKNDQHYGAMLLGFGHDKWVVASMTFEYIIFNPVISELKGNKKK